MSASRAFFAYPSRRKPLAACVAALFGLSASGALHAAGTAFVTNCSSSAATSGSLPWAALQAVTSGDIIDMTGISDFSLCAHNQNGFDESILLASAVTVHTGVTIKGPNTSSSKALAVSTGGNGRVFYSSGSLTIRNLGIKYGKATSITSGAVYGGCVLAEGGLTLNNVVLDHCEAYTAVAGKGAKGGAVATFVYGASITLTNTTITNSSAISHTSGDAVGGAVYAGADVTLTNSTVSHSEATAESGFARGGGIAVRGGTIGLYTVTLTNSEVSYSYAYGHGGFNAAGGGIYSEAYVTLTSGSTIKRTKARQFNAGNGRAAGGGIFSKLYVSVTDSTVKYCNATTASNDKALGGGVYGGAKVALKSSDMFHTVASSASGDAFGGGIFSVGGTAAYYSTLAYNSAALSSALSKGGAIYAQGGVKFKYGTISGNSAQQGGGIGVPSGNLYLRGATLFNNQAQYDGSAIGMFTGGATSTATIVNSTISGNTVNSTAGKYAVYIKAHSTKLYNSTIAYNTGGAGAGTYLTGAPGSTAGLYSTLMSSNSQSNGTQNDFAKSTDVAFTVGSSKNLIRNPTSLVPNGTLNGATACPFLHPLEDNGGPTLTHRLGGVLHVAGKNPAIDKGSNAKTVLPVVASDQRGGAIGMSTPARVSGSAADIGAFEVQQDDTIFDTEFETCPN